MEGINNKYNIEIEVLTPLSIGAGTEKDWVRGIDFVVDKGKLYKLNLTKLVATGINPEELSSYFATKNENGLKQKLAGKLASVSDMCIPMPAQSDNDIKSFVKNQLSGNPVLTGSSLKGSIRSILFQYLGGSSKSGNEVFGSSTKGDEFMRFFKISDAEFDKTELVNTKIFNLRGGRNKWEGGWKHAFDDSNSHFDKNGFNTLYECLTAGQKSKCSISLAIRMFDNYGVNQPKYDKKKELFSEDEYDPIENLFYEINSHTYDYLKKELDFFKNYNQAERSQEIINSTVRLLNQTNDLLEENRSCILKMSAGSGFHSITGDWQFSDYYTGQLDRKRASKDDLKKAGTVLPKSRKIAEWDGNLSLMGFVKLTIVE